MFSFFTVRNYVGGPSDPTLACAALLVAGLLDVAWAILMNYAESSTRLD